MKLRQRTVVPPNSLTTSSTITTKSKAQRNILSSPNHTITSFFKKAPLPPHSKTSSTEVGESSRTYSNEKSTIDKDHEFAMRLQMEFDQQFQEGKSPEKLPLQARSNEINIPPSRSLVDVKRRITINLDPLENKLKLKKSR
jgi:hypothetical protein